MASKRAPPAYQNATTNLTNFSTQVKPVDENAAATIKKAVTGRNLKFQTGLVSQRQVIFSRLAQLCQQKKQVL